VAQATGNDFMVANNVPPHLTLSAIEARSVDALVPAFESSKKDASLNSFSIAILLSLTHA